MLKAVIASIAAGAATLLLSVGAAAGADVQHMNLNSPEQCFTYTKGGTYTYTYCVSSTGEMNSVLTPSGNFSGEVNAAFSSSLSQNGTLLGASNTEIQAHVLFTVNATGYITVIKEDGMHLTDTFTYNGVTCIYATDFHITDFDLATFTGHIQYYNSTYSCV